ncbi:MAG: tetratricopeptide repeat protein [Planctomycetes bacterium]|nr:tetratricopeptide repeat protein [Planctomycetota bacterium]
MTRRRAAFLATAILGAALLSLGCGAFGYRAAAGEHHRDALRLLGQERIAPALAQADQAVACSPADPLVLLTRADVLRQAGRPDEARRDLERARRLQPDLPVVVLVNAMERASRGNVEEALALLEEALARGVASEDIRWLTGLLRLRLGRHEAAEAAFLTLIERAEVAQSSFGVAARLGLALARSPAAPDAAAEDFAAAARGDLQICLAAMQELGQDGFEQDLRALAARAAALQPDDLAVGLAHAGLLQMSGCCDEAVAEAERLLALEPDPATEVQLWLVAAAADARSRRFAGAREKTRRALDLDPACLDALFLLHHAVVEGRGGPEDLADLRRRIATARGTLQDAEARRLFDQLERSLP